MEMGNKRKTGVIRAMQECTHTDPELIMMYGWIQRYAVGSQNLEGPRLETKIWKKSHVNNS